MRHAVKHIRFVGMVGLSREQGSRRRRDATGREGRRMSTSDVSEGGGC